MRLGGISSGFDTHGLVERLMEIERQPIQRMEKEIEQLESTKEEWRELNKTLQSFMDELSSLQDKDLYFSMEAESSHEDISVTAERDVMARTYDLEVSQIARAHRISSGPIESIQDLDDVDEPLELEGDLELYLGDEEEPYTIEIESEDSLADIRDKINDGDLKETGDEELDNRELPLEAQIIGDRLVIEAEQTGESHSITKIGGSENVWGQDGLNLWNAEEDYFSNEIDKAQDAKFQINGLDFENESNTIDHIIDGVTIDIGAISADQELPVSSLISIELDDNKAEEEISEFVESYNEIFSKLQDKGRITLADDEIDRGPLQGDSLLRNLTRNFRTRVTDPINAEGLGLKNDRLVLSQFGIEIDRYGEMTFDKDRFKEAQDESVSQVYEAFGGEHGIGARLQNYLEGLSFSEGAREADMRETAIGNRKLTLDRQIDRNEDRMDQMERRLESREDHLWSQFSRMEQALNNVYSEGNWLQHQYMHMSSR
ncbi:flagellar filament capping protein FliD [Natranaerobius thermophilus]|uniref:Flagellar hook-associated protein 2 n=1 Tax=Natranaerobius thermophilus (strain ATCC BAA-1301 / DSM 18059 / JW/NM-WN-LF) TaxID=457570 RepID=B2A819_NATTJ|nr:flagellar filament capping protein FliD [Natranaerobius thermophilus]ACB85791.1 flagellar hook-associated 2 domain protein [Natranaerobius thermophilus JW/NM-WN-LF]